MNRRPLPGTPTGAALNSAFDEIERAVRRAQRAYRISLAGCVFAVIGFVLAILNLIFGG